MKSRQLLIAVGINTLYILACCKPADTTRQISAQMAKYDRLIEKMNTDSIAALYTVDGQLGNAAKGRDSLSSFLKRFANYRVLQNKSTTDSIRVFGDSSVQVGNYRQITILPGNDTVHLRGRFKAIWKLTGGGEWKIYRMETTPTAK